MLNPPVLHCHSSTQECWGFPGEPWFCSNCSLAPPLPYMVSKILCDFFFAISLAGEDTGCTWRMTEKSNGVKSSPAKNHNHHAPLAIKANGKDDHRTSSR